MRGIYKVNIKIMIYQGDEWSKDEDNNLRGKWIG